MIDFESAIVQKPKLPEFSVSEFCNILKSTLEETFSYVRIKGEISGLKVAPSGHVYFNLKDQDSVIAAICWKGSVASIPFKLEDGLEVICAGKITIYAGRSNYQIIVSSVEMAGIGAILAMLEKRKKKLEAEGIFNAERKKELPLFPKVIGIITSPTGAVIRDILHRINERFPLHVIVWPVLVQGNGAADQISAAINGFQEFEPKPDLLIVARGGGSIEDLMPFNEETVIRAAANSRIPLISAIGHETDTTLIDFAADRRAPTPTGAAEIATPVKSMLLKTNRDSAIRMQMALQAILRYKESQISRAQIAISGFLNIITSSIARFQNYDLKIKGALNSLLQTRSIHLIKISQGLDAKRLAQHIENLTQNTKGTFKSLNLAFINFLHDKQLNLEGTVRLLSSLNYKSVLNRGFAMVWDNKTLITRAESFIEGKSYKIEFSDGYIHTASQSSKKKKSTSHAIQGDLFS